MKVAAHRGFSARHPENSIAGFEAAIAAGADYVETDVRMTADGVLVCSHDPDLGRVAGVAAKIAECTAQALEAIELAGGGRILRLDAVLALARGRVPLMLDVKLDDAAGRAAIIGCVAAAGMADQVVYGVRSAEHARALTAAGARFARLAMPAQPAMLDAFPDDGLVGVRLRWVAGGAALLLASFGTAMALSAGLKSPLDYSVFSASAAALLLAFRTGHQNRG